MIGAFMERLQMLLAQTQQQAMQRAAQAAMQQQQQGAAPGAPTMQPSAQPHLGMPAPGATPAPMPPGAIPH